MYTVYYISGDIVQKFKTEIMQPNILKSGVSDVLYLDPVH